jgi:hypothetical protein
LPMLPWTVCDGRNLAGRLWLSYRRSGERSYHAVVLVNQ